MTLLIRPSGVVLSSPAAGTVYDAGARPLQQPVAPIIITAGGGSGPLASGIVFDSPDKGYSYSYNGEATTGQGGSQVYLEGFVTCGRILPQEWGPPGFPSTTHTFADIDLGAAPSWANFCELTINLNRSVTPDLSFSTNPLFTPWPIEITAGANEDHEDGWCVVEAMAGLSRQFGVELVGGRILLRRQQSITDVVVIPAASGNPAYPGLLTHVIQAGSQELGGTGSMNLGQAHQGDTNNTADYKSVYTGTLAITLVNHRGP